MPTKICIIEVDLGFSIDDIINEDVEYLTGAAEQELDAAIEAAKAVQRVKKDKENAVKAADTKLNAALEEVYTKLVEASDTGLPVSTVMKLVENIIQNSATLTIKLKTLLSNKGNPYILDRKKVHGTPHYVLTPFNHQPSI